MRFTLYHFFLFMAAIVGTSSVYAQSMQDNSMSTNDNMVGGNMSGWENNSVTSSNMTEESMMNGNMSNWGNGSMMDQDVMMASGNIDLSMASPILGSPNAPVTIIQFGDYQCPKCDAWFKNEEPTIKANYIDSEKAKLYFIDFPFLGADSPVAAQAAYCAGDQGKYWQYHDYLYSHQQGIQSGWASISNLKSYASALGLDTNQFNSCLDSGKYFNRVAHNKDIGISRGVKETPAFFIVGPAGSMQEIMGPQPASVFSTAIDKINAQPVPEFGSIAALVLVLSIMAIIILSTKTGLRFIPKLK